MNPAGQGIGLVHEIRPAAELVERMVTEAAAIMRRMAGDGAR
jgi:NAD(P)H-dependent flavin oxidoreductase YrpB (nitropropane dioxygenase family)